MNARAGDLEPQQSANERLVSFEIVRQVLLLRHALFVQATLIRALNKTEHPVAALVREALSAGAGLDSPAQLHALEQLISRVLALRSAAWATGTAAVVEHLRRYSEAEVEDHYTVLSELAPGLGLTLPIAAAVAGQAVLSSFQGRTIRQWYDDAREAEAKRIRQALFVGVGADEDPATVARRVVGSAAARGSDGATQVSRNNVASVTRSSLVQVSTFSRSAIYTENAHLLSLEQLIAVLDSRTTDLCRGLNGKRFPVGHGPRPPLHINCRSLRVVVLPGVAGGRLWKAELYDAWLRRQPHLVRVELMGVTRAAQTRRRLVDFAAFVDYGSRPMSLQQVRVIAKRLRSAYN